MTQPDTAPAIHDAAAALGTWFHNIDLLGVSTAPGHPLGDFPACVWQYSAPSLPTDLSGRSVLDIGCNGGFFSIEMKRRGAARVLGIDTDDTYLTQARFAAKTLGLDIEYRRLSVYDVAALGERFDVVIFMGVLYHLRHPLLALDLVREHAVADLMLFQTLERGSLDLAPIDPDYPYAEEQVFEHDTWPRLHFVEHSYAADPTNWWIPNRAATEAMLRDAGFTVLQRPNRGTYLCRRGPHAHGGTYPATAPSA